VIDTSDLSYSFISDFSDEAFNVMRTIKVFELFDIVTHFDFVSMAICRY